MSARFVLAAGIVAFLAHAAHAQETDSLSTRAVSLGETSAALSKDLSVVVMPVPLSDPTLGNGLAVGGIALYMPKGAGRAWTTGAGALYTDTDSWAAGVFQKAYLFHDKARIAAFAGYGDFNLEFFGIGQDAGDRNRSIDTNEKGTAVQVQGLWRIHDHLYVGPRYRLLDVDSTIKSSVIPFPDLNLPDIQLHNKISSLGVAAEYDTRDSEYGPRKGIYATANWIYGLESLGSDFEYSRAQAAVNLYHATDKKGVLAARASFCAVGEDAPFYDLCLFGANNDLRGYSAGRYRDHALAAVQAEYRRDLFWRFGAVVFAGFGAVAEDFSSFKSQDILPSAGFGLRFAASKRYHVNASIDAAWGKDSDAVYFSIGEAF